ncbi:hypothetical protein BGX34_001311, partial [Mortierella sp. NVP85]
KTVNKRKDLKTHQVEEVDPPVEKHGVEGHQPATAKHTTLAVKQKAVIQATFKYRRWLQVRKDGTTCGTEYIASIERSLPAFRGPNACVAQYEHRLHQVGDNLEMFYNKSSNTIKGTNGIPQKAYRTEYAIVTDKLLKMIGGSAGKPKSESNKSIIAVVKHIEDWGSRTSVTFSEIPGNHRWEHFSEEIGEVIPVGVTEGVEAKSEASVEADIMKVLFDDVYDLQVVVSWHGIRDFGVIVMVYDTVGVDVDGITELERKLFIRRFFLIHLLLDGVM